MTLRIFLTLVLLLPSALRAQDSRPNILWIVSEDNSASWLGCYGNSEARTPRLDAFAAAGLRFTQASSNAPVCAVARATLLMGAYSPTMGTQHMRSRHPIPSEFKPYVTWLREAGYYCTNNSKTDYNFKGNDDALWDESSGKAHYRQRRDGKPFFAIFNLTVSHESSLFPATVEKNRRNGIIPPQTRLTPSALTVPPWLPDLPEVRQDLAIYHDTITALDTQVGGILDELDRQGLKENTIVFYYGDHGGPTPRGKRYLEATGTRIPLLIRFPEKWQSASPWAMGTTVDELVSFVDFAPTLLSLTGQDTPPVMQGRAFLGSRRKAPPADPVAWLFADRFDEIYGMRRAITDGRFRYQRRFLPHLSAAPYSYYQFDMPSWSAWRKAWKNGELSGYFKLLWESPQAAEELFDSESDPGEIHNLAADPAQAARLAAMRQRLRQMMAETRDTSLVPEPLWAKLCGSGTIHAYVRSPAFDPERTLDLAFQTGSGKAASLPAFMEALASPDPVLRYWGAVGCIVLGESAAAARPGLEKILGGDPHPALRITAAHAMAAGGQREPALASLVALLDEPMEDDYSLLLLVTTLETLDATNLISDAWIDRTLQTSGNKEYVSRLALQLKNERAAKPKP